MRLGSGIIGFGGLVYFIISVVQWFFLYPDTSQLFLGIGLSISLFLISILYERTYYYKQKMGNLEDRLDSLLTKD